MMALWGFVFVLVGELVMWRVRSKRAATKAAEPPPDDAEKLLNELLAQAEAKMAAEAAKSEELGMRSEEKTSTDQEPHP